MIEFILPYAFIGLVLAIILASFISKIGEKRKIGASSAFIVSILLGPLIGLIIVLASDELEKETLVKKEELIQPQEETATQEVSIAEEPEVVIPEEPEVAVPEEPEETHEEYVARKIREEREAEEEADKTLKKTATFIIIAVILGIAFFNKASISEALYFMK
jgi:hypothetical protein